MCKTIYLVRHAEPRLVDGTKLGLSPRGKDQARALSKALNKHLENRDLLIMHSGTKRSKETATLLQDALNCSVEKSNLRFEGAENLRTDANLSIYSNYMQNYKTLGIESPTEYSSRILGLLNATKNSQIAIVSHEVPIRVLLYELTKHEFSEKVSHASCFRVIVDSDQIKNLATKVEKII